jgi:hypothetical protein
VVLTRVALPAVPRVLLARIAMFTNETDPNDVRLVSKRDRRLDILQQIALEWMIRPDLRLDAEDAQARWRLAPDTCVQVLDTLVDARVLVKDSDGIYSLAGRP